jgi:hypothetical protein
MYDIEKAFDINRERYAFAHLPTLHTSHPTPVYFLPENERLEYGDIPHRPRLLNQP